MFQGGLYMAYHLAMFSMLMVALTYLLACIGYVITYGKEESPHCRVPVCCMADDSVHASVCVRACICVCVCT